MSIWFAVIIGLAVGVVTGVFLSGRLNFNPSRVQELETQIRNLNEQHARYRDSVSDHFGLTAELVQHMTESYKDVYQHLALGAQDLCTTEVASKLLPAESEPVLNNELPGEDRSLTPPRDYAAKLDPEQKGALAEDFGLEKTRPMPLEEEPALEAVK